MIITKGFPDSDRPQIAALYWEAFGAKLGPTMGPAPKAMRFFEAVLYAPHAICAREHRHIRIQQAMHVHFVITVTAQDNRGGPAKRETPLCEPCTDRCLAGAADRQIANRQRWNWSG